MTPDDPRAFWHSLTVTTALRHAQHMALLPWGETDLRRLPDDVYQTLRAACGRLVQDCLEAEAGRPYRSAKIEERLNAALWHVLLPFNRNPLIRPPQQRQESFGGF